MSLLRKIAADMRTSVEITGGKRQYTLSRGLTLTLIQRRWGQTTGWTLSLTRRGTYPSQDECAICRRAFSVPDSAAQQVEFVNGYGVIRYTWEECPRQIDLGMLVDTRAGYYTEGS